MDRGAQGTLAFSVNVFACLYASPGTFTRHNEAGMRCLIDIYCTPEEML